LIPWCRSLADDVCSVDEAKEVYPKLGILANVGLIAAGAFTRYVTETLAKGNEILSLQVGRLWLHVLLMNV
jgi:ATP/ADP translocase